MNDIPLASSDGSGGMIAGRVPLRLRRPGVSLLKLLVGGGLCAVLLWQVDAAALTTSVQRAHPLMLMAVLACMALNIIISAVKWQLILAIHGVTVRVRHLHRVYLIATFFNNFLPTNIGGDGYRVLKTADAAGSRAVALIAVVMERVTGIAALLGLGMLAGILRLSRNGEAYSLAVLTATAAAIVAAAVLVARAGAARRLVARIGRREVVALLRRHLADYRLNPRKTLGVIVISVGFHLFSVAWLAMLLRTLGAPVLLTDVLLAWTASSLSALIPLSVNGLGIQDASFVIAIQHSGVEYSTAVLAALLLRALVAPIALLGGALYLHESAGGLNHLLIRSRQWPKTAQRCLPILGVLAGAALLRFWGIDHGLPQSYYPDEAHLVKRALSFGSGDLNPHWFHKPAFLMYVLFAEYGGYYLVGRALGAWSSVHDFAVGYIIDPSAFYLIGRLTTATFGLATVWLVYHIGERHVARGSGVIAAVLFSLTMGAVQSAQETKEDTPATFFLTLSMLLLLEAVTSSHPTLMYLAAAAAGAGSAIKAYPMVMLLLIPLAIITVRARDIRRWHPARTTLRTTLSTILVTIVVYGLVYFACSPFSFLDPLGRESTIYNFKRAYLSGLRLFGGDLSTPDDFYIQRLGIGSGAVDYLSVLLNPGMGPVIGSLCILGWLWLLRRGGVKAPLLCLLPAIVVASSILVFPGYAETRHQVPVYPMLAIGGGALIAERARRAGAHARLVYAAIGLALLHPLGAIAGSAVDKMKNDTRNVAKRWIETHVPAGTRLLVDENGPPLLISERRLEELIDEADHAAPGGQFTTHYATYLKYQAQAARRRVAYDLHEIRKAWWRQTEGDEGVVRAETEYDRDYGNPLRPVGVETYSHYLTRGFRLAVIHSDAYAPYIDPGSPAARNRPKYARFYSDLLARGRLIATFSSAGGEYRGPEVKVLEFQ